jgi:DNA polymerase sigma
MNPRLSLIIKRQLKQATLRELPKMSQKFVDIVQNDLHGRATLFGSAVTGLSLREECDLDICIEMNTADEIESLKILSRKLKFHKMKKIETLFRARIPIVKFFDPYSNVQCDVNINKPLGIVNSRLLKAYVDLDERVPELIMFIKYWAKMNHLHGAFQSYPSSYAWSLLVLHFLQKRRVIPDFQDPALFRQYPNARVSEQRVDGWNCNYFDQIDILPKSTNDHDIGSLLIEFFEYYSSEFNFGRTPIFFGGKRKSDVSRLHSPIFIIDPFERTHNVTKSVNMNNLEWIIKNMKLTLRKIAKDSKEKDRW